MLIGRDGERAQLRRVLADARGGRGAALVIRGEPGIGKTSLLEDLRGTADGFRVLSARCVESESRLAFAGLADLLRPILDRLDALPAAQGSALRAALALGPPGVPDRFAAYAATLGVLDALAEASPVLVLVDDGQWLDAPSREALIFCARRLSDTRLAIVATSREIPRERLDLSGVTEMVLGPLDDASARRLVARVAEPLPAAVAVAVLAAADGNPLALVELSSGLTPDERAGRRSLPATLRAGEVLTRTHRSRFEALGQGGRRAALLTALSADGDLGALLPALTAGGGGTRDLAEAEAAGLVVLDDAHARLRHPLLRSVVLALATPAERRAAHIDLAAALDPRGAVEQRAWHLAESSLGPDEVAASAMERAAGAAAARTGYAAAARSLERAAALSPDVRAAGRRRVGAAQLAMAAGDLPFALALLDGRGLDPEAAHLRGVLTLRTGGLAEAARDLVRDGERIASDHPGAAAAMVADAVLALSLGGDCRGALRTAQRALGLAGGVAAAPAGVLGYLGGGLTLRGRGRDARALIDEIDRRGADVDPLSIDGQLLALSQVWRIWVGDFARETARLEGLIEKARSAGAVGFLAYPLAWSCEVAFRTGRWGRARAHGEEALTLLTETGQVNLVAYAKTSLAVVEAGLGFHEASGTRAREAMREGRAVGAGSVDLYAASALAFDALGRGDPDGAREALAPLVARVEHEFGLEEPGTVLWQPDLVEALARLGRTEEARGVLARLSEQAHRTGGTWARAVTCRGRGMIDDDIDRHFGEALALHAGIPMPFERARTELAYGGRLRRAGRRTGARTQLERALATFDELGAQPWSRQAREEIAASGARLRPRRGGRPADELSPRELQVALAVADGATNREVAARLFLSEKTVERHLGSVYRKLGMRSRTELARHVAAGSLRR